MAGLSTPTLQVVSNGVVQEALPASAPDTQGSAVRLAKDGSTFVRNLIPTKHLLAADGTYYTASSATIGTAVTYALTTAFSATAALFAIKNNDTTGKKIFLNRLRLIAGAVAAAATSVRMAIIIDPGARVPTANNVSPTIVNLTNGGASIANLQAFSGGSMTVPAASGTQRQIDQFTLRQSIPIAGDEFEVYFGGVDTPAPMPGTAAAITIAGRYVAASDPIIIQNGETCLIYLWEPAATTTAPTFEWSLGWWER